MDANFDYHGHFVRIAWQCVRGGWTSSYSIDGSDFVDTGDVFTSELRAVEEANMIARDVIRALVY